MSESNSIDDSSLEEHSSLSETEHGKYKQKTEVTNNSDHAINNADMNDEYILSLLNNSGDSEGGRYASHTFTESSLHKSCDLNAENTSTNSNDTKSTQVNKSKEISDNVLNCDYKNVIELKNANASKEEQKLAELKVKQKKEYRDSDSPWTDDEDSSSSSSSDSDFLFESIQQNLTPKVNCVKTKGELDIEDLPPIEYLKISVGEEDLKRVGKVHAIVFKLVVIKAAKDEKPLDIDSVLFLAPNEPLGRIFEVFGPVVEPFYTVLFNAPEDIVEKSVKEGSDVFFAPLKDEITAYVFIDMLRQQKGSDASWKDNNEPPEEHLDYSDDEQERAARLKRRGKGRVHEVEEDDVLIIPYKISPNEKRTFNYNSYTRNNSSGTQNDRNSTQNCRNSIQNNKNVVQSCNNLDNVPVWISTPPSYLEPKPLPSQTNVTNTRPVPSFQLKQPASLQIQNQLQPLNVPPNSSQAQFRSGTLLLNPKQAFVPRQPPDLNSQRVLMHHQSQTPPSNGHNRYFPPPQRPSHHYATGPILYQNACNNAVPNQHIFGQITPVGIMSPAPPMSPAIFSPCPSPAMYVSTNAYHPLPSPALSPNPFWRPQNQHASSFTKVQNPPSTAPLTIQIPTFSNPPPIVRFSAASNYSVPPPPLSSHSNFSTPPPYSRF